MEQRKSVSEGKLFSKNFVLLLMGQISSLFANTILRFALSMYILELTQSALIFGGILAFSMVPTIVLSPFGGILADRANRKKIMVALDFLSGVTAFITLLVIQETNAVLIVGVVLSVYAVLGAFESPTVQAAVPQMQTGDNIIRANAVVNQIAALAALIAPFIGSACYTAFGIRTVLMVSVLGFFLTSALEVFIKLPYKKQKMEENWIRTVKSDFRVSVRFITKEKPEILRMVFFVSTISFFIMGTVNVGLPFIIRTVLGLKAEYVGVAESVCGAAAIIGSIIVGVVVQKLKLSDMYKYLIGMGLSAVPMGLAFLLKDTLPTYFVLLMSVAVMQVIASIFSIYVLSVIQQRTPNELLGKIMAYVMTISLCMQPLGQMIYGILFETFTEHIIWIMLGSAVSIVLISVLGRRTFVE